MDFPDIFKGTPTPAKWAALGEYLRSSGTTGGPGLRVRRVGNKTVITTRRQRIAAKGEGGTRGAFYTIYTVVSEDATNGDIMLTGGQVTAGTGTETVPAFVLYDASTDTWAGAEGEHLQLAINGEGEEVDDVLMPVFNQDTGGSDVTVVAAIADNILPEVGALSGLCNVSLGVFTASGFTPSLVGNIQASFCYGGFTVSRF